MGTRSTTKIYEIREDNKGKESKSFILGLYKQYDGYIGGWGKELKKFIKKGTFVNGINENKGKILFNGIGDFALLLVKEFKEGAGDLYATSEDDDQEFNYIITYKHLKDNKAVLTIECGEAIGYKEISNLDIR